MLVGTMGIQQQFETGHAHIADALSDVRHRASCFGAPDRICGQRVYHRTERQTTSFRCTRVFHVREGRMPVCCVIREGTYRRKGASDAASCSTRLVCFATRSHEGAHAVHSAGPAAPYCVKTTGSIILKNCTSGIFQFLTVSLSKWT